MVQDSSAGSEAAGAQRSDRALGRALLAARTAEDNRGRDIVVLDLRELTTLFDYFVVASGTSRRQLHAMSEEIDRALDPAGLRRPRDPPVRSRDPRVLRTRRPLGPGQAGAPGAPRLRVPLRHARETARQEMRLAPVADSTIIPVRRPGGGIPLRA